MKIDNEKLLYIIILVIIGAFVLNMKNVYNFFGMVKRGELFKKKIPVVVVTKPDDGPKTPQYTIVTPVGTKKVTCNLTETIESISGTKDITIDIYTDSDEKVSSLTQSISYDGVSNDFANYLYSESSKFESLKNDNISVAGFSVEYEVVGTTSMSTNVVFDTAKATYESLKITNSSIFYLVDNIDKNVDDIATTLVEGGFTCARK